MQDSYNRTIDYVRISVTDRCNFRCRYCMPPEGIKLLTHREILSYEEILRVLRVFVRFGVRKVRITGGEPLVRKGIVDFIRDVRMLREIKDLAMTTNGSLLGGVAHQLKEAGLDRVNISIDTFDPQRFAQVTGGDLTAALHGISSALAAGLTPVKLNVVMTEVLSENDIFRFVEQVYAYPIAVRFIEYMPIGHCDVKPGYNVATVKNIIQKAGHAELEPAADIRGNGPARYYRLPGTQGTFGFITPISDHYCCNCNRIRLTADGRIKPCLLTNHEIDLKPALRGNGDDHLIAELLFKALAEKPPHHQLDETRKAVNLTRDMFQVGG